jgi:hypothetical protein
MSSKPPPAAAAPPCPACAARWALLAPPPAPAAAADPAAAAATTTGAPAAAGAADPAAAAALPASPRPPPPPPPPPPPLHHPAFIRDAARGHYTLCDVRRAAAEAGAAAPSVLLAAHGSVYRVPREWAERVHPGGPRSILYRAGADASADFDFHSHKARGAWGKFVDGRLVSCTPGACSIA